MAENIVWHPEAVLRQHREELIGQRGGTLWFTGLSGSGKSTVANAVAALLHQRGRLAYVLDGDNVRHGLCRDLGFTPEDRVENIRRIGELAKLMTDAGVITLAAFVSPYRADRALAAALQPDSFLEVYVKADLETCEARDPKGLYKKARAGEIKHFTGIDDPYEEPLNPALVVDTSNNSLERCATQVIDLLIRKHFF
ncbi:MAG: adenylyl-sulfate kinase [Sumerlaeia bacterium]